MPSSSRSLAALLVLLVAVPVGAQPSDPEQRRPPAVNRFNEVLPEWLRVRGEFRERGEGSTGSGFTEERDDYYWLSRVRLNVSVTPRPWMAFTAQLQDARVAQKTIGPTGTPFTAPFDLRMAYASFGRATSPVSVMAGRQELLFGEQRLVGPVNWLNAARSFDGVKVTWRQPAFTADVFGASLVRMRDGSFDRSGYGNRFAGVHATTARLVSGGTAEPYVYWRRDVALRTEGGTTGDLGQTTIGLRVTGRLPARMDYGVEMAVQRGSLGSDTLDAWAGHWQLRGVAPGFTAARLVGEYNYASGDRDPADRARGTFDHLYPTPHDKYGLADQVGWKNVHHLRGGLEFTPWPGWPMTTNYHTWWLAEPRDALYTAGGAQLARVVTGATHRHVGQEIDVQVSRALTPQLQLSGGYAHMFPGGFLNEATPGSHYNYSYVMATYVFLAER